MMGQSCTQPSQMTTQLDHDNIAPFSILPLVLWMKSFPRLTSWQVKLPSSPSYLLHRIIDNRQQQAARWRLIQDE
jgi:hypothetical protein